MGFGDVFFELTIDRRECHLFLGENCSFNFLANSKNYIDGFWNQNFGFVSKLVCFQEN